MRVFQNRRNICGCTSVHPYNLDDTPAYNLDGKPADKPEEFATPRRNGYQYFEIK